MRDRFTTNLIWQSQECMIKLAVLHVYCKFMINAALLLSWTCIVHSPCLFRDVIFGL